MAPSYQLWPQHCGESKKTPPLPSVKGYLLQVSAHLEHEEDWVLEHQRQARTWCETWQGFWHERGEGHVQEPVPASAASASDAWCLAFGCCPRLRLSQPRPGSWQCSASSELLCKQGRSNTGGFCPFCPSFSPVPAAVPTSAGCAALRLSDWGLCVEGGSEAVPSPGTAGPTGTSLPLFIPWSCVQTLGAPPGAGHPPATLCGREFGSEGGVRGGQPGAGPLLCRDPLWSVTACGALQPFWGPRVEPYSCRCKLMFGMENWILWGLQKSFSLDFWCLHALRALLSPTALGSHPKPQAGSTAACGGEVFGRCKWQLAPRFDVTSGTCRWQTPRRRHTRLFMQIRTATKPPWDRNNMPGFCNSSAIRCYFTV